MACNVWRNRVRVFRLRLRIVEHQSAFCGQTVAVLAVEECDIQNVLKRPNLRADGRLSNMKTRGCRRESTCLHDGYKIFEKTEFEMIFDAHADLRCSSGGGRPLPAMSDEGTQSCRIKLSIMPNQNVNYLFG